MGAKVSMSTCILAVFSAVVLALFFQSEANDTSGCREHYYGAGDYILGGLFDDLHPHGCESDIEPFQEGFATLHKIEAMVFALQAVNNRTDILPGVTLGFDIYDTCGEKLLAVKQALNQLMYKKECQYMEEDFCSPTSTSTRYSSPLLGVVGSEWSSITTTVSYHYNAFRLPIVSYFSSSDELSDKNMFPSFLRVIPPDRFQVQAIIAMIKHFHWTSVAFIYTDDSYGRSAFKLFENLTYDLNDSDESEKICIADYSVNAKTDFDSVVHSILGYHDTTVVILFTHPVYASMFVKAMVKSKYAVGKFQLIASDAWANHDISDLTAAAGTLKIRFVDKQVPQFEEYFQQKIESGTDKSANPWFHEFSEFDIQPGFSKESGVSRVMDSVLTFAHGLDATLKTKCADRTPYCLEQAKLNFDGSKLLYEMKKLNFMGYNEHNVTFYSNSEDIGRYEIVNIQCNTLGYSECHLVPVGKWNSLDQLLINESTIVWGTETVDNAIPSSTCEGPLQWRHGWSTAIVVINCIGLLCALVVAAGYIWNRRHPLLYASGISINLLSLFGVIFSYILVFAFVAKPSIISCYFRRVGYMLCFTIHFAPLLVHTFTIYRRYTAIVRNSTRPGFTSSSSEMFFSLSLILIQVGITIVFLIVTPPKPEIQEPRQLTCNQDYKELAVSIVFNVILISLCSVFAFLTKKVPKNFKESRFIGFSVYTTLVIWVLFVPSYVNAPVANWKVLIISFALIISASVTLIFLFMVKLYAIYMVPDANLDIAIGHPKAAENSWPSDDLRSGGRKGRSRVHAISQSNVTQLPGRRSSYGRAIYLRPAPVGSTVKTHSINSDTIPPSSLVGDEHIYPSECGNWL